MPTLPIGKNPSYQKELKKEIYVFCGLSGFYCVTIMRYVNNVLSHIRHDNVYDTQGFRNSIIMSIYVRRVRRTLSYANIVDNTHVIHTYVILYRNF